VTGPTCRKDPPTYAAVPDTATAVTGPFGVDDNGLGSAEGPAAAALCVATASGASSTTSARHAPLIMACYR